MPVMEAVFEVFGDGVLVKELFKLWEGVELGEGLSLLEEFWGIFWEDLLEELEGFFWFFAF